MPAVVMCLALFRLSLQLHLPPQWWSERCFGSPLGEWVKKWRTVLSGTTVSLCLSLSRFFLTQVSVPRSSFILVAVQEYTFGATPPTRALSEYSLDELLYENDAYNRRRDSDGRGRRQASTASVYIAANITESTLESGFTLGSGEMVGGYRNHRLRSGFSYNVGLISHFNGTNTTVTQANSEFIDARVCTHTHTHTQTHFDTPLL